MVRHFGAKTRQGGGGGGGRRKGSGPGAPPPRVHNPCYRQGFIDDGSVFHPKQNAEFLKCDLAFIYPPHLWFEFITFPNCYS